MESYLLLCTLVVLLFINTLWLLPLPSAHNRQAPLVVSALHSRLHNVDQGSSLTCPYLTCDCIHFRIIWVIKLKLVLGLQQQLQALEKHERILNIWWAGIDCRLPQDLRLPIEDQEELIEKIHEQIAAVEERRSFAKATVGYGNSTGETKPRGYLQEPRLTHATERSRKPLPPSLQQLYQKLQQTPILLSKERLNSKRGPISCGGSGTVLFKSWESLLGSTPVGLGAALKNALPETEPSLAKTSYCALQHDTARCEAGSKPSRCAIVGNSGKLRETRHGAAIDSADFVLRFNSGKTHGYESWVGTKSHARLYNGPYAAPKQPGEITVAQLRDPATRTWLKTIGNHPGAHAYMFDPEFLCLAWEWVDGQGDKPSSGMVGVLMGLSVCETVDVYGFDFSGYFNQSAWSHYYDKERPKPGREKAHPFEKELSVYTILEDTGLLSMPA